MAEQQQAHVEQARANRAYAEEQLRIGRAGSNQSALDWAVTVAFYAAVHCVDAALAAEGLTPGSHLQRQRCMEQAGISHDARLAYKILMDLSQQGRYEMRHFSADFVERAILGHWLPRLERLIA